MQSKTLDAYQQAAAATAVYPDRGEVRGLMYLGLGLCGEAGEVAEKIKKIVRDDGGQIGEEKREAIGKELGDVLWYMSEIATHLGLPLSVIAGWNNLKLAKRKEQGRLGGSGDDREVAAVVHYDSRETIPEIRYLE